MQSQDTVSWKEKLKYYKSAIRQAASPHCNIQTAAKRIANFRFDLDREKRIYAAGIRNWYSGF
jgi:hypothetical protein